MSAFRHIVLDSSWRLFYDYSHVGLYALRVWYYLYVECEPRTVRVVWCVYVNALLLSMLSENIWKLWACFFTRVGIISQMCKINYNSCSGAKQSTREIAFGFRSCDSVDFFAFWCFAFVFGVLYHLFGCACYFWYLLFLKTLGESSIFLIIVSIVKKTG